VPLDPEVEARRRAHVVHSDAVRPACTIKRRRMKLHTNHMRPCLDALVNPCVLKWIEVENSLSFTPIHSSTRGLKWI
jgi:hypothetical protein